MSVSPTELTGYLASSLVLASLTMTDVVKLRYLNSLGCLCFMVYGLMLSTAWPIVLSNGMILVVNLWRLFGSSHGARARSGPSAQVRVLPQPVAPRESHGHAGADVRRRA